VIIALIVASLVTATMIELIVQHHRQIKVAERRQQAEWLAISAVQRARQALMKQADYVGETWQVPSDVIPAGQANEANIRVIRPTENSRQRRIEVVISAAQGPAKRVLFQTERTIELPSPGGSS
jgi:hypothetical protein